MEHHLQNFYPGVTTNTDRSCGGNQKWLDSPTLQRYGCGAVAALDFVRYLHLYHKGCRTDLFSGIPDKPILSRPLYDLCVQRMRNNYVPVLPYIATNGVALTTGLNSYFRHYHLPLRAVWATNLACLWSDIGDMLDQDLPVILSIGKPVKHLLKNEKLKLYQRAEDGQYVPTREVSSHFVTVLGQDDTWLQVSSWGKVYYINHFELMQYIYAESAAFLCNIVCISKHN